MYCYFLFYLFGSIIVEIWPNNNNKKWLSGLDPDVFNKYLWGLASPDALYITWSGLDPDALYKSWLGLDPDALNKY